MKAQLKKSSFSKPQLAIFVLVFGLLGIIVWRSFAANPNLPGDINNDNIVNITDLSLLLSAYGTSNTTADLNGDSQVNVTDLSILLSHFGQSYAANCSTSSNAWQNAGIANQTGTFTATFSVVPNAQGIDAVTGFSNGSATDYSSLAVIVRFATNNIVDAVNGGGYQANSNLNYTAGQTYQVRMVVNIASRTYDAYVTPSGGTEVKIANGYSFRSEQASVTQLNNWATIASVGSHQVCNMQISGSTNPPPPPPSGTTRDVYPGQSISSAITASSGGDTVKIHAGSYPMLTLSKSFSTPLKITGESGVTIAGVLLADVSGYDFSNLSLIVPADPNCCDASAFYLNGSANNISLHNSTLKGGFVTIKFFSGNAQSSWINNINIYDNDISATGGDLIHLDGAKNVTIEHNYLHDPINVGGEHHDAIQDQASVGTKILRNTFSSTNVAPMNGIDGNGQAMFINGEPASRGGIVNILIANNLIKNWNYGRSMQVLGNVTGAKIVNNTIIGGGGDGISLTVSSSTSSGVEIWNNIFGDLYCNDGTCGAVSFISTNWYTNQFDNSAYMGANAYTGNPQFVDTNNYALVVGGAGYTKGLNRTSTPTIDIDNATRPNPPALGARL